MTGRPTRLTDLVREPAAFEEARRRCRAIAAKTRELKEERGIETCFVAFGMATWTIPGCLDRPQPRCCCARPPCDRSGRRSGLRARPRRNHRSSTWCWSTTSPRAWVGNRRRRLGRRWPSPATLRSSPDLREPCRDLRRHRRLRDQSADRRRQLLLRQAPDGRRPAAQGETLADHDVIAALAGDPTAPASVHGDITVRDGERSSTRRAPSSWTPTPRSTR